MTTRTDPPHLVAVSHTGLVSGAEAVLLRVMEAARDAGWKVTCLAPDGEFGSRLPEGVEGPVRIPDLKLPSGPRSVGAIRLGGRALVAAGALRRAARDADVVLVNGILALPSLRVARLRAPTAWIVHDVIHRRSWRALLRASGGAVGTAVAVSDAVAVPLREAGLPTRVVRNGTPWPVDPAPLHHPGPPVVGCAALLTSWKGQDVLLDAVAQLSDPTVIVELAGGSFPKDAPYVAALECRASAPDLSGRVRFLGRVDDLPDRMRAWTVAVLPSVDPEAAPLSLLEYMSHGIPAVATDHGGSPEVLDGAGLLVPPDDATALAAAIGRLLASDKLRASCAAAGPAQIAERLTLDHQRAETLALLDELAGRQADAGTDA